MYAFNHATCALVIRTEIDIQTSAFNSNEAAGKGISCERILPGGAGSPSRGAGGVAVARGETATDRVPFIRDARIESVGKCQSCMVLDNMETERSAPRPVPQSRPRRRFAVASGRVKLARLRDRAEDLLHHIRPDVSVVVVVVWMRAQNHVYMYDYISHAWLYLTHPPRCRAWWRNISSSEYVPRPA